MLSKDRDIKTKIYIINVFFTSCRQSIKYIFVLVNLKFSNIATV